MKKIIVVFCGLLLGNAAMACNMDRDNCADTMLPELKRYADELSANPKWQKNADPTDVAKVKRYKERLDMCSTNKCVNETLFYYTNEMRGLASKYRQATASVKPAPAAQQDIWENQCVYVPKANVARYWDPRGSEEFGVLRQYAVYLVSQTDKIYVNLKQTPNDVQAYPNEGKGSWIGWVKKSDLEMQDLRNCN